MRLLSYTFFLLFLRSSPLSARSLFLDERGRRIYCVYNKIFEEFHFQKIVVLLLPLRSQRALYQRNTVYDQDGSVRSYVLTTSFYVKKMREFDN